MLRFPRQSCRIICVWLLTLLVRTTSAHADRGTELSAYLEDYKRLRLEAQELVRLAKKADLGDDGGLVALGKRILDVRVRLNRFSETLHLAHLEQLQEALDAGLQTYTGRERFVHLYVAAEELSAQMNTYLNYLSEKRALFSRAADMHGRIWDMFDSLVR